MPTHGTAFDLGQYNEVVVPVVRALPKALDGIDPKSAIRSVSDRGEALEQHLRRFFDPSLGEPKVLRPRFIVPIPQVPVNYDLDWNEAVSQAGPNTGADWDVRKVGHLYVAKRHGLVLTDITLVNFGEDVESEQVLEFGREYWPWRVRVMDPRECFALGAYRPNLHQELGLEAMAAVSLEKCDFRGEPRVPGVWWRGAGRGADLRWFVGGWRPHCWFGFVRE